MPHQAEIRFPPRTEATSPSRPSSIVVDGRTLQIEICMERMNGGEFFHLALGGCVFNNIVRLARERGIEVSSTSVRAEGDFDEEGWSKGVTYDITLAGRASDDSLRKLAEDASADSAIAVAIEKGAPVRLTGIHVTAEG